MSNEGHFQSVIPELMRRVRRDLYLGVGPEQNFTYIAAIRPRMAFIVDIRRGNLHLHLLYKALFEMSSTRAEFLARLFSRDAPPGMPADAPIGRIFAALEQTPATEGRYRENLAAVVGWLTRERRLPLGPVDIEGIDYVYRTAFFADGPDLNYRLTGQGRGSLRRQVPTYAELMTMEDGEGVQRSYLASEANFGFVKDLQTRNAIVPVVGDFAGPKALRAIAQYAREHESTVSAFYLSNVEQYLRRDDRWETFCASVAAMPLDRSSTFIRSYRGGRGVREHVRFNLFASSLGAMRSETRWCGRAD